jgi:alpha-glucoside transport system substrate-binding protein
MNRAKALLAAALLALGMVPACSTTTTTLTVLGPWTGAEEQDFRAVLDAFAGQHHLKYTYQGTRAVNQVLLADVQKGQPPDVAVLSGPGELARYARSGDLLKITGALQLPDSEYSSQWRALLTLGTTDLYAVPVKADLKSIVWFDPSVSPSPKPRTWDELIAYTRDAAARGTSPWCLGMEAFSTSGWPGTDWIEDILLHQSGPQVYQSWAAGTLPWTSPEVRRAWAAWGELLDQPGAVLGGRSAALLTYFGDAAKPMFEDPPRCLLEHQASFAPGSYPKSLRPGQDFDFFPFPEWNPAATPAYEASVNLAGLFTHNAQASELMAYLAGQQAQAIWPSRHDGSAFSVNQRVLADGVYRDPVSQRIARTLASGGSLCLDASDVMPAEMADAFFRGVLEYLGDPTRLDAVLDGLEKVRTGLPEEERLNVPCGG